MNEVTIVIKKEMRPDGLMGLSVEVTAFPYPDAVETEAVIGLLEMAKVQYITSKSEETK